MLLPITITIIIIQSPDSQEKFLHVFKNDNFWKACGQVCTQMYMDITGIDLLGRDAGRICCEVRLMFTWISRVLIYLIKMHKRYAVKLALNLHA